MGVVPLPQKLPGQSNLDFLQWLWGLFQDLNDGFRAGLGDRLSYLSGVLDGL